MSTVIEQIADGLNQNGIARRSHPRVRRAADVADIFGERAAEVNGGWREGVGLIFGNH